MKKEQARKHNNSIRRSIDGDRLIKCIQGYAIDGEESEEKRVQMALRLLEFVLPKLKATDITSGGKQLTVQVVKFGDDTDT